jgi:hypothetical protein
MIDNAFRSRNPLFKMSERYQTEKQKRRLKRSKGKPKQFSRDDFYFDKEAMTCRCPAGDEMWCSGDNVKSGERIYRRFVSYLKDCKDCLLQTQCMRKAPNKTGR